jgi:RNA polymerase sigma factor (sigma-70 family)
MESKTMRKDASSINKKITLDSHASRRDRKAVAELHTKYFSRIKHHIASSIGSTTDAEDLAQDVFVEFYKGNGCFRENGNPERYLFGIARNMVRGYYREKARSARTIPIEEIGTHDIRQQSDPVNLAERQELIKIIEQAVTKLPPKARQVLELRLIKGLDSKKAAKEAGCSCKTLRKRLNRAITTLQKELIRFRSKYLLKK